ncbi:hypothetical protein [Microbispora sp. NPDC049125]|uniref:hypothetical protein n=1 Tax=Microbispora sp. NPDC049125 TaxID=3154929 RepID=UPI00346727E5
MIPLISYYADLAIGLVLAFLLLSLLVSGINEGIVKLLGIRSKFLWAYLRDTLDGGETAERVSAPLRALDRVLHALKGLGRRLRAPLMDLLPPPAEGRSRLPATVLGVFAKLPFGKDPRPPFSQQPAPVESPPLAPAADSVAGEQMAAEQVVADQVAADQVAADQAAAEAAPAEPVMTGAATGAAPGDGGSTGVLAADGSPVRLTVSSAAGPGVPSGVDPAHGADEADPGELGQSAGEDPQVPVWSPGDPEVDPAHGADEADPGELGQSAGEDPQVPVWSPGDPEVDPAHDADQADPGERVPPAGGGGNTLSATSETATSDGGQAPSDVVPPSQGKSMAELLHERLQEIDHRKRGKTSIADIPPARFAVAIMEIATEHGGVEKLMRDLDTLGSPLYRPLKAVWDRASHDMEAFRHGVEEWFDGEMERLSLLYRRYVRWVVAVLGLFVTLAFSMDALEYGKTLLKDNAYRSEVTAFAQSGPTALAPLRQECEAGQDPYTCVTDVLSTPAFVKIFTYAPVSATMDPGGGPVWRWRGGEWWHRLSSPAHWPGFLLTLVALLFGAPFWWDILRRISGVRSRSSGGSA